MVINVLRTEKLGLVQAGVDEEKTSMNRAGLDLNGQFKTFRSGG